MPSQYSTPEVVVIVNWLFIALDKNRVKTTHFVMLAINLAIKISLCLMCVLVAVFMIVPWRRYHNVSNS